MLEDEEEPTDLFSVDSDQEEDKLKRQLGGRFGSPKKTFMAFKSFWKGSKSKELPQKKDPMEVPTCVQNEESNEAPSDEFPEKDRDDEGSTFFDSLSRKWVKVDNFAFSESDNHFQKMKTKDGIGSENMFKDNFVVPTFKGDSINSSFSVESETTQDNQFDVNPGEEEEVENLFAQLSFRSSKDQTQVKEEPKVEKCVPKIVSPRDEDAQEKTSGLRRRLSDELKAPLPSRSNPNEDQYVKSENGGIAKKFLQNKPQASSKYTKHFQRSNRSHLPSPIQRKVGTDRKAKNPDGNNFSSTSNLSSGKMFFTSSPRSCSKSDGCLHQIQSYTPNLAGRKQQFPHVQSKVKQYIQDMKDLSRNKSSSLNGRKCLSMSNLNTEETAETFSTVTVSNLQKMKSFLSSSHLEDVRITVSGLDTSQKTMDSVSKFDHSRISRLLDQLSDDENNADQGDESVTFEVEEVLALALEERREKKEAEKVLSQLQENYDLLQRKYAEAENKIDKLRFGQKFKIQNSGAHSPSGNLKASTSNDSSFIYNNTSNLLFDVREERKLAKLERNRKGVTILNELNAKLADFEQVMSEMSSEECNLAMSAMKKDFNHFYKQNVRGQSSNTIDDELIDLLAKVGDRLQELEIKSGLKIEPDHSIIDPIEKVEKWKIDPETHEESMTDLSSRRKLNPNASSCYGSLPTSPSPPTKSDNPSINPIPTSPPAEFDSGYPGSDRSTIKHYSLKVIPKAASEERQQRFLFNLKEEQSKSEPNVVVNFESDGSSSLSEFEPLASSERKDEGKLRTAMDSGCQLLKPPSLHHTYLHSVTDLSSDERSMFDEEKKENVANGLKDDVEGEVCKSSRSALSSGRQPVTLAKQIDIEINELRNFFDDHREEMLTLLNENSKELFPNDNTNVQLRPCSISKDPIEGLPRRKSLSKLKEEMSTNSFDSGTDLGELQQERKLEFKKRRRAKKKQHLIKRDSNLTLGKDDQPAVMPNFVIGAKEEALLSPQNQGISAFFPPVRSREIHPVDDMQLYVNANDRNLNWNHDEADNLHEYHKDLVTREVLNGQRSEEVIYSGNHDFAAPLPHPIYNSHQYNITRSVDYGVLSGGGGREISTDAGPVFVPRLDLNSVVTDDDSKVRDPRSFDFNNSSWISCQSIAEEDEDDPPKSRRLSKKDCASQTKINFAGRSQSLGELSLRSSATGEPLVIVQSCCRHSEEKTGARRKSVPRVTSSRNSDGHLTSKRKKKKSKRTTKELKELLASLEQANKLAANLRERSKDIVEILGSDIDQQEKMLTSRK